MQKLRLISLAIVLVITLVGGLILTSCVPDGSTPTPNGSTPTPDQLFTQNLARLQDNAASMPLPVGDVIDSFTMNVTRNFTCPEGSIFTQVTLTITTKLIPWDPARKPTPNAEGAYFWLYQSQFPAGGGGPKTVTFNNELMLDPAVMTAREADPPLGTLTNEGLLYHELLHGQLLINAMNTSAWQQKVCDCTIDLGPMDANHVQIPTLVNGYFTNRAPGINIMVVEPAAQPTSPDGSFTIDLGPTEKTEWTWKWMEPDGGSNIDTSSLDLTVEDGHFLLKGKLINKTEPGKIFFWIDP